MASTHCNRPGVLCQGLTGATGCDVSVGTPDTTIFNPPPCTRHCTERHEALHSRDLAPCCKRAKKAYDAAKTDEAKEAAQDKFNKWGQANEDFLECRAYAESTRCGEEFLKANCEKASAQIPEADPAGDDADTRESATSLRLDSSSGSGSDSNEPESMGEAKSEPADTGEHTPQECCVDMRRYTRVSKGRRDTTCARAGKALTPCPF
jgi:hypothetical protein